VEAALSARVRSATRSSRLSESRRSASEPTSGSTAASRSLREAAKAVARASSPSFLRALPAKLESTLTRAENLGGTSTTDSSVTANLTARCRPRPPAFSTAQRRRHPSFVRCDNGLELTANALRDWCRFTGPGTSYIEPGSPWENPWVESYGSRMRDELLAIEQFASLLEAQVLVGDWRTEYNTYRLHSALDGLTPADYAEQWRQTNQPGSAAISSAPVGRERDGNL
jgi:transposase InsO family protein